MQNTKGTLAAALNCGAIDGVLEEKDDRYRSCDYIFSVLR